MDIFQLASISNHIERILFFLIAIIFILISIKIKCKIAFSFSMGLFMYAVSNIIIAYIPIRQVSYNALDFNDYHVKWEFSKGIASFIILSDIGLIICFISLMFMLFKIYKK